MQLYNVCVCLELDLALSYSYILVHHNGDGCAVLVGSMLYRIIIVSLAAGVNLYEVVYKVTL